ncbi:MAG TPA: CBS domain-containing protein [Stellaceae bacterium]|nr:CBS domain-containing protein [Stellaceae bacterium]
MKVSDIMTHPVITVTPETTVGEAAELMIGHRISGRPSSMPPAKSSGS